MNNFIFLVKKKTYINLNFLYLNMKYINNISYFCGKYGFFKFKWSENLIFNINFLKSKLFFFWNELNSGWIGILYLNGLGFKSTRKLFNLNKRYWRFNVGHSHVFQYFTPRNILMKIKMRYVCIFGCKKNQVMDITKKLKTFHIPDPYKGVGIKYPNEIIFLKKGKMRQ